MPSFAPGQLDAKGHVKIGTRVHLTSSGDDGSYDGRVLLVEGFFGNMGYALSSVKLDGNCWTTGANLAQMQPCDDAKGEFHAVAGNFYKELAQQVRIRRCCRRRRCCRC